ncbi:UvrD-helicase domain-containing protein [Yinghuangia sp. YIM S10712]|uniref:UvrD-helicase domain-containing protein n=1 Tax=Yinghuangia sp. YIM S10712 TaxID=3436930 RepID=UPI003F535BF1
MSTPNQVLSAEQESEATLRRIVAAVERRQHFRLDAGAGSGKTTSLIDALRHVLDNRATFLPRAGQRIACVTYTNVACNEIVRRTDDSPHVFAATIHGFLWEAISRFQKHLRQEIPSLKSWPRHLDGLTSLGNRTVEYDLGFRRIDEHRVALHHEDIPELAIRLLGFPKFRSLIADRFPVVFVDEYQDTPEGLAEAMLSADATTISSPTYGFFGDHWQQIYDRSCGLISRPDVITIQKRVNWRSGIAVVDFLNKIRPELPQATASDAEAGSVTVYHTNGWTGPRGTHSQKGHLPDEVLRKTLSWVRADAARRQGQDNLDEAKILMLTHTAIAGELGFRSIARIYRNNDDYVRKNDAVIALLADLVEPACAYFRDRKYALLFDTLKRSRPRLHRRSDKAAWSSLFGLIEQARMSGTVGDVLDVVLAQRYFSVPDAVVGRHRDWQASLTEPPDETDGKGGRRLVEYGKLRDTSYREVIALCDYIAEATPFSTQHGVKGTEYPDVVAVFGGWNLYDFPGMLAGYATRDSLSDEELKRFERARNLFYVACSRARCNLVLLFTHELPDSALNTLRSWVTVDKVVAVDHSPDEAAHQ